MPNKPSSAHQAKQSSHLAPRDEPGAWQSRKLQEGLTQRRKGAKISEALLNFAPLRLCVRSKTRPESPTLAKSATASWSAVAEMRGRSLASATPLSNVHRLPQTLLALAKRCRASLPTALHDAVAKVCHPLLFLAAFSALLTGCLDFGSEQETLAPNVTDNHLRVIEKNTGIKFPAGSVGMAFYLNETGIDPWLEAKIKIPADQVVSLLNSEPFTLPQPESPANLSAAFRPWWKPGQLVKIKTGEFDHGNAWVQWTLGKQNKDVILYIHWMVI